MPKFLKIKNRSRKIIFIIILVFIICTPIVYAFNPAIKRSLKKVNYQIQSFKQYSADLKLDVPYHKQEHSLSCEVATLKMAFDYYGVNISEDELISELNFDTKKARSKNNIWGDPDLGFVGDINGRIPNGGYGVYEDPIIILAEKYRGAKKLTGRGLTDVLREVSLNHPVIVWGTLGSGRDISWETKAGKKIKAVYAEHTRLLIGFSGTINNPTAVILHDPIYGTINMSVKDFLKNWATLGNKAVVIY